MNPWLETSMKNLLALSEEKHDFKVASREWSFTGKGIDHGASLETCELCEKDQIRYHFEITNALENVLWVGSHCIEKFDIKVIDENGNEITEGKNSYLLKLVKKQNIKKTLDLLFLRYSTDEIKGHRKHDLDKYCFHYYYKNEKFDARMVNYLFMRFQEEGIPYDVKSFAVSVRSDKEKAHLLSLADYQFSRIKGALSTRQIQYYVADDE